MKKLLSLLLAVVLVLSMVPVYALADDGATITISGRNYRDIYIVVNDSLYYANENGTVENTDGSQATFAPGTYTIYYGAPGQMANRNFYKGTVTVEEGQSSVTATLGTAKYGTVSVNYTQDQWRWATSVYYNTNTFNHIHPRVNGSYILNLGGTKYNATVSNPKVEIYVNGVLKGQKTWTSSTSYEWTYNTSLSRTDTIEIHMTVDLTYTANGQNHVVEDVEIVYNNQKNVDDFIRAVAICDGVQGFDFTISQVDIQSALEYYEVVYQWRVYNLDGSYTSQLPAGIGDQGLPAGTSEIEENSNYIYDTVYVEGTSYHDYENGLLYTFHGWDTYSHSSVFNTDPNATGYYALDDGDMDPANNAPITITADTWINGYWTVSELKAAPAYLLLQKNVVVDQGDASYVTNYLQNISKMLISIDPGVDKDGDEISRVDAGYPSLVADGGYTIHVYQYEKPFLFREYQADIPGYTRKTTVTVSGSNVILLETNDTTAEVELKEAYSAEQTLYHLGTVTYTNTYTKNVGTAQEEYPSLTLLKSGADNSQFQSGVVFTLYRDAACTDQVAAYTTDGSGLASIDFTGLKEGTYYLKETAPLPGYKADPCVYAITLAVAETKEELRYQQTTGVYEYVTVTRYALGVSVPENSTALYTQGNEEDIYYRLHIYNEPILGSLELSKVTAGLAEGDKNKLNALVVVHGPITRDEQGNITDVGSTWKLELNSANSWAASLGQLTPGEYLIHESFASVHGYTWESVTYGRLPTTVYKGITSGIFTVKDETPVALTLTNTYKVWTAADFYIHKVNEAGKSLEGAVFQLSADEAGSQVITTQTTGADGYAHFSGYTVPEGQDSVTYYLREVTAPKGYYLSNQLFKLVITAVTADGHTTYEPQITLASGRSSGFDVETDLLTVVNYPVLGELSVTKTFAGGIIPEGYQGVSVQIGGPNGYSKTVVLNTENNWAVSLKDLPIGTYTIYELDANVPGYTWKVSYSSNTVTLTEQTPGKTVPGEKVSAVATVTNSYTRNEEFFENPTSLTVKKVDGGDGKALAGAVFTLDRLSADGKSVISSRSFTTGVDGTVVFDLLAGFVGNDGTVQNGTYILSENSAPEGYVKTNATWTISVREDDGNLRVELNENKNIFENFWDWVVGSVTPGKWENGVLTVTNEKKTGSVYITKRVEDSGKLYQGEEYAFTLDFSNDAFDAAFTLKDGEEIRFDNIPWGTTYVLTEQTSGAAFTGIVNDEGNGRIWADETQITVTNTYRYVTHNLGVNLVKVDSSDRTKVISGAGFTLFGDEALQNPIGGEVFSDESGRLVLPIPAAGEYYLAETTAPAGYHRNDRVYAVRAEEIAVLKNPGTADAVTELQMHITVADLEVSAENGFDYIYTVENTPILPVEVSVKKIWYGANVVHPTSVEITLYRDGEAYDTVTLNGENGWSYTWTELTDEFTWTVDEPSVPSGYNKTIRHSGYSFTVVNTHEDNPKTGDFKNHWGMLAALSLTGFCVTALLLALPSKKKKVN